MKANKYANEELEQALLIGHSTWYSWPHSWFLPIPCDVNICSGVWFGKEVIDEATTPPGGASVS